MTQLFKVQLNGTIVTDKVVSCRVSETMNRFYNVASFSYPEEIDTEGDVIINYGDRTFEGFVFSIHKNSEKSYSIECRTHSARLTTPYSIPEESIDAATTSHELCALYATAETPIVISAIDLDFGGDYERSGTKLSALTTVANTTGAEYYVEDGTIYIAPNKPITDMGEVILERDIFDFVPYAKTIESRGVGVVYVGDREQPVEVVSNPSITVDVDRCTGDLTAMIVPHNSYAGSIGTSTLNEVQRKDIIKVVISEATYLELSMDIVRINSVTVDNIAVGYSFEHDTLILDSQRSGVIVVDYVGYAYDGKASIKSSGTDKYMDFTIYYGNCDVYKHSTLLDDCTSEVKEEDFDDVVIVTPDDMNYPRGFTFHTIVKDETAIPPEISFRDGADNINRDVVSTIITDYSVVEDGKLSYFDGSATEDETRHLLTYPPTAIVGVRSNGVDIPYTLDGDYLVFDDNYDNVKISYETTATENYVQFDNIPNGDVYMDIVSDVAGDGTTTEEYFRYVGDGVTTFFEATYIDDKLRVYLDDVLQDPSTYTLVEGGVIFDIPPALGVSVVLEAYGLDNPYVGDGVSTYPLAGTNLDDINDIPCGIPVTVPVNVIDLLGVTLQQCRGKQVSILKPSNITVGSVVDGFGIFKIEADAYGVYDCDTGNVQSNSSIVVEVLSV